MVDVPPKHLQFILDELVFISLVKSGEKINFSNKSVVDGTGIYSYFIRRVYGENTDNLVLNLRNLLELVEGVLKSEIPKDHRVQILCKVIDFHRVVNDQIVLYDKYPHTVTALIGFRDRLATILSAISDDEKILIKQRRDLSEAKIAVIGTPPGQSPLAARLANER
jgi:hypothetical protein